VFVTVISAVAVLVVGFVCAGADTRGQFNAAATIVRHRILRETTVPWNDPPRRAGEMPTWVS